MALDGSDAESHRRHGLVLMALGRVQQATSEMRRALEIDPLGSAWIGLGVLLQSVGDLNQAETAYRRHLQFAPDSIPSLVGLGRGQLLRSNPGEALGTFERCPAAG